MVDDADKNIVRMKKTREQKIREAMTKKTPYVSSHGMTPQQIRKALGKVKKTPSKNVVREVVRRKHKKNNRPDVAKKPKHAPNPMLLLDTPVVSTKNSVEYPTPSWFRSDEEVDVSVIIPMYKSQNVIEDLINSWVFDHKGLAVELIFVDDNSPNKDKEFVVRYWMRRRRTLADYECKVGRIYYNPQNQGFGTSCNIGAEKANGKYLIFLNADTKVTNDWINPMIRLLRSDDKVGIVGNMQIKEGGSWDGTIDGAGSQWTWEHKIFDHIGRHIYNHKRIPRPFIAKSCPPDLLVPAERDMVTGCCFAVRKELWDDIGGFNPNYRIGYWEDSELCMTVKEKGYKIMYQPFSKIYHKLGHTSSGGHHHDKHNRNYFFNKWVNSGRMDDLVEDKREFKPEVKTILLQREAAHGDVLVASMVASALKKKHEGCSILFNTGCKEVLKGNPWINKIVAKDEISERSFRVFYNLDMAYEYRPHTNILDAYAELVGVKREDCQPFILQDIFQDLPKEYVVIHAGKTAWVGRDWSQYKFDILAKRFMSRGIKVVLVGKGPDHKISCDLDLRNKTKISQLAYIINKSKLFVGIDSFPMHVAQQFNKKGVCFFGSINPETRIYSNNMVGISAKSLKCIGCHHRKPAPCVLTDMCETGTLDCINMVSVDRTWNEAERLLDND